MLANILIAVGLVTGLLGLLDGLLLNERQKRRLADRLIIVWSWVDDVRRGSFVTFLNRRSVRVTTVAGGALFVMWTVIESFVSNTTVTFRAEEYGEITIPRDPTVADFLAEWDKFLVSFTVLAVAGLISNILLVRVLTDRSAPPFFKASAVAIFIYLLGSGALQVISLSWARIYYPGGLADIIATIAHVVFTAVGFVLVFPLVLFFATVTLLYVLEYLMRRVAEQPKGPLAAVSALMTAAGGSLKVFA